MSAKQKEALGFAPFKVKPRLALLPQAPWIRRGTQEAGKATCPQRQGPEGWPPAPCHEPDPLLSVSPPSPALPCPAGSRGGRAKSLGAHGRRRAQVAREEEEAVGSTLAEERTAAAELRWANSRRRISSGPVRRPLWGGPGAPLPITAARGEGAEPRAPSANWLGGSCKLCGGRGGGGKALRRKTTKAALSGSPAPIAVKQVAAAASDYGWAR